MGIWGDWQAGKAQMAEMPGTDDGDREISMWSYRHMWIFRQRYRRDRCIQIQTWKWR